MENPLISVIVPAYNAERTLGKCVESILAQNYTELELLIVDDGSTDRTGAICDDYASKDSRVRVIHKINGGVGAARNSGLDAAKGEFVTFVDSDDSVKEMYLMNLYEGMKEGIDIVISGSTVIRQGVSKKRRIIPTSAVGNDYDAVLCANYVQTGPWAKLFRTNSLDKIALRFREDINMGEDAVFVYSFIEKSDGIAFVDDTSYLYNNEPNPDALTQKFYSFDKELQISTLVSETIDSVIKTKNVRSGEALSHLNDVKCIYRYRVINSIYAKPQSSSQRLISLQKVDTKKMWLYSLGKDGFRAWLLSHLLRYRMLRTYDFIRSAAVKRRNDCHCENKKR